MILRALRKKPKTFTDLLNITGLPRKTLSLRLKDLLKSRTIVKNGNYHLNGALPSHLLDDKMTLNHNKNAKKTLLNLREKVLIAFFVLCIGMPVSAQVFAMYMGSMPEPKPPIASFIISPNPPYYEKWIQSDTLTFDASTSYSPEGAIVDYIWDFDDGTKGTGQVVTHVYEAGIFSVELTVVSDNELMDTTQKQVTVLLTPCLKFYFDPPEVTGLAVGDVFTLEIAVSEVTNLQAWECGMTFNPDVLECMPTEVTKYTWDGSDCQTYQGPSAFKEGPFLKRGGETFFVAPQSIYVEEGVIHFHGCCLFGESTTPVSGSGILAYITFKVIAPGASELHLTDVLLLDPSMEEIPVLEIGHGYFELP